MLKKIPLDVNSFIVININPLKIIMGKISYYIWSKENPVLFMYLNWTFNYSLNSLYSIWNWAYIESSIKDKTEWYSGTGLKDKTNIPYNYESTRPWNPCDLELLDSRTKEKRSFSIELFYVLTARLDLHYFN